MPATTMAYRFMYWQVGWILDEIFAGETNGVERELGSRNLDDYILTGLTKDLSCFC